MENNRNEERRRAYIRAERRKKQKKAENILIVICSIILSVVISLTWNLVRFTIGMIFPVEAKYPNVQQLMLPEEYGKYFEIPYMKPEYFERYLNYEGANPSMPLENIVTYCNMGIDVEYFTREAIVVNDTDSIDIVINKVFKLPDNYEPDDLVIVDDYRSQTMREEAALAFQDLKTACKEVGFDLLAYSGYRSTELQTTIYNNMINNMGEEHTDQYVSKPGHSEHTTGLAVDVSINGTDYNITHESEHYDEFLKLISDYGFIIRYPEGKQELTGYSYESWHIRYVGVDIAKEIEETGLTLDEYVARL